jgi:hypothetical protein
MNTNDFNYGQTVRHPLFLFYETVIGHTNLRSIQIFLVTFLAAELPSGLISKRVGADVWIPFIMMSWSLIAGSQAFIHNRSAFFAIKALLGLFMGGFIPYVLPITVQHWKNANS